MTVNDSDGTGQKETVTVTFLTNHEIDPDEFDLRVRDPDKIRRQLMNAANSTGSIQQVAGNSEENLQRLRKRVKKAKQPARRTETGSERPESQANAGDK